MESVLSGLDWEMMYAPYDQQTYEAVLDQLGPEDIILDIGAGDLRLSRQMAWVTRRVYAVEINPRVLDQARALPDPLPARLIPICADARKLDFPAGITAGVLLMRHCSCFRLYVEKLRKAGAARLFTNARWHMHVEIVDLLVQRKAFMEINMGWYACICGGTGFKEGPAEHWSPEMDNIVHEVSICPQCMQIS
jgi:SAM-dependent methyltransferase